MPHNPPPSPPPRPPSRPPSLPPPPPPPPAPAAPASPPPPPAPPRPLPPANIFNYENLDLYFLQDTSGPPGVADPSDVTNAFHFGATDADNSELMTLLDTAMLGAFGGDMQVNPEHAAVSDAAAAAAAAATAAATGSASKALERSDGDVNNEEVTEESIARAENQFNTASNNVPGAGPLPPATFAQTNATSTNTLTEFTKRRNWPAKVVEELKDLLQILDANGRIKYVSPSITSLIGYSPDEVRDVFVKDLIHPDDQGVFVAELNESIASGNPLRLFYRLKKKDGTWTIFEAVGHAHIGAARFAPNPNNQSPFCQAVFMMARLYPTKNASLLDSFLEHKIENERLKRRIAELRREEEAEADEAYKQWMQSQEGRSDVTPSEDTGGGAAPTFHHHHGGSTERSMMPADKRPLNTALTKENLEGAVAGSKPDSLRDKMERYEATSHTDTIEMLTGLRYVEGERSRGITTGNASPMLIKGDAGIRIPLDRDSRLGDKKKKLKTAEEYVCTDCGTLDSPEWRKGPSGPKTLCNACGLRWAKKEKKRNGANTTNHRTSMPDAAALG